MSVFDLSAFVGEFGSKIDYLLNEASDTVVCSLNDIAADEFDLLIKKAVESGFAFVSARHCGDNRFCVYRLGDDALYLSYYPAVRSARLVYEQDCSYLSLEDVGTGASVRPMITQVDLEDYGLSYVVRTCDGRFIVFDGGWEFEPDADSLYKVLCEQSGGGVPVIAAWIMTHPHIDHYRCFLVFHKKYGDKVRIERFIYNFPDPNCDAELIPLILHQDEYYHITRLNDIVKYEAEQNGAVLYRAHTGQVYELGGVRMEVLTSPDDTFKPPVTGSNNISLVFRLTVMGQTILMTGDSNLKYSKLASRFGGYLKCDILQLTHHGFGGGDNDAYRLVDPHTVLAPVFEREAFGTMCIYMEHNLPLIYDMNVEDFYVGGNGNISLTLPYTPRPNGRKLMFDAIEYRQNQCGARTWFFCDMTLDDAKFTFVNTTYRPIRVTCDLYFEDKADIVTNIEIEVPAFSFVRRDLAREGDVDDNALFFNRSALFKKGIKPGAVFAARFTCRVPFVVKGNKAADFYA